MIPASDPGSRLLAEHATVTAGDVVLHMSCGPADFALIAATNGLASHIVACDRNFVAVENARLAFAQLPPTATRTDVFASHGAHALPASLHGATNTIAIRSPREKVPLLQLLWDAFALLRPGGACYVAGANNEGMKSAVRLMEELFGNAEVIARASGHRMAVSRKKTTAPADASSFDSPFLDSDVFHTFDVNLRGHDTTLFTRPGVFSWDHLDEATAILANVMHIDTGDSVLDLGCGAGALGITAARLSQTGRVVMVDADVEAVRSAQRGVAAAGVGNATVLPSDVGTAVRGQQFDVVVTNPPFHTGKATDLELPRRFIEHAWHALAPGGRLYLVANRTLPYETEIRRTFGAMSLAHDGARFKVVTATKAA